jgi:hypothetical protein
MEPFEDPMVKDIRQKRATIVNLAKGERLEPFKYLDMVGDYAEKFGLDPDYVYKFSKFDTVTAFLISWKEKAEFQDRYSEWDKLINQVPK